MDSNTNEYEQELLSYPEKLVEYLSEHIEIIERTLNDDEDFCNQDINSTLNYVEIIEKKFNEKIQTLKKQLEQIRLENKDRSEKNKKQFQEKFTEINDLFIAQNYVQALNKFKDCEKQFQQRSTLIQHVPKLYIKESDIDEFFSSNHKTNISSIQSTIKTPITTLITDHDIEITYKERSRQEKIVENDNFNKNDEDFEDINKEKKEDYDKSSFGIRSKRQENPPPTINNNNNSIKNDNKPSITTATGFRPFRFSTRLNQISNDNNLLFSGRNISVSSSIQNSDTHSRNNHRQAVTTPSPPVSIQRHTISISNDEDERLILNPVSHYQHERNIFLLIACDSQYIVCFKSPPNRLDRWKLGTIERRTHREYILNWHDGLIISMGSITNSIIYIFTEREFFIYSLEKRCKLDSRMLPRGDDDELEINYPQYNESQRGIGSVYDKYMYHIYLNRKSHWTLSKNILENLSHVQNYDLTDIFPNVLRFIHICINENTINFLVQMNDSSYGVVFYSINNSKKNDKLSLIKFPRAQKPLTICSAFIQSLNQYIFFINDPSIDTLHIISTEKYLENYSVDCYAICYVANKHELIIVTNTSISSINLHKSNLFFSKFF
ncbi:unnamed protein product [Rotaria sp. Silwood1]|nr:unnamed protein product [Rotaria sp. Silwood1]